MNKAGVLVLRVDPGLKERLKKAAGERGMSDFVVKAIEERLAAKHGKSGLIDKPLEQVEKW